MKSFLITLFVILSSSKLLTGEVACEFNLSKHQKLIRCLEHCWGVDPHTAHFLCKYFHPFSNHEQGRALIEDFINQSFKQNIQFSIDQTLSHLPHDDGVIQATQFHPVVFESPYVRILAGCASPGEREPFHSHMWKSLLVVFEEATYKIEYEDRHEELLHVNPGVYELPPEDLYACTNIGTKKENCLRFEIKDVQQDHHSTSNRSAMPEEENLEAFEAKIAYFFGVPDPQPVKKAYLDALKQLKTVGLHNTEQLQNDVLPHLEKAYRSIAKQRNWYFDTHLAAQIELKIILGNANDASFENVVDLMEQLYTLVFQSSSPQIVKAAMLRTFLYQYKAEVLKRERKIPHQDRDLMIKIANTSEELLNSIK